MLNRLKIIYLICGVVLLLVTSCDKIEYNSNQKFDRNSPRNTNSINLQKLSQSQGDNVVRFILSGDTQRGYGESEDFVKKANTMQGIDFVVIAGDISDFGLLQEMEWIVRIFNGLKMPYLGVIGNHDLTANGKEVFQKVFGELDYSFVYQGVKFICLNTNGREVNFDGSVPDINWLNKEVKSQAGVSNIVAISHITPNSTDFDKKLELPFVAALESSGNCVASLHAHDHTPGYYTPYANGIPFIVTGTILKRTFTIITITNGVVGAERVLY